MQKFKWLAAAGLVVATTAACTETTGYPNTAYYSGSGYYSGTGYYRTGQPVRQPGSAYRDQDRDGIPNRYDRDANGNGVSDRFER